MEPRKQAIMAALDKFVAQRPGLEFGNYGDVSTYRSEMRSITRDRHDYNALARAVERSDSITADMLVKASKSAFSGRLAIEFRHFEGQRKRMHVCRHCGAAASAHDFTKLATHGACATPSIDYVTGQYFPTEYRKAACAVLASALWEHYRENCMPASDWPDAEGGPLYSWAPGQREYKLPAGDWLRACFRREFGRSIASRWFQ